MATSNGPDRVDGRANCCCDPCSQDVVDCNGECCKCVPAMLCVTFTPDTPTDECIEVYSLLGSELNDGGTFIGSLRNIVGKGIVTEIEIALLKLDGVCLWLVTIDDFYISEEFVIDGEYVTCSNPSLDVVIGGDCPGIIHIEPYLRSKVPFQSRDIDIAEVAFTCGGCSRVCDTLCVDYSFEDMHWRREFVWNSMSSRWENDDDYITPTTNAGACELEITIADSSGPFNVVTITNCGIGDGVTDGLIFTATSSSGSTVRVSCNACSCWQYICGTCRCACDAICLMLQSDYGIPEFLELAWDGVNSRWGDDLYSIALSRDAVTGGCKLTVPGWDAFAIDSCGTDINFSLEDNDGNRAIGRCKNCHCFTKPAECCGTSVYELPNYLVATVEDVSGCSCFTTTVYLLFDPTGSMWSGSAIGGCADTKITVSVMCTAGSSCPTGVSVDVCCNALWPTAGAITCGFASGFTTDTATCPPLLLILDEIVIDRACCENEPMAGGTIKITITE